MVDIRQTPEYAQHLTNLGWKVIKRSGIYYYTRKMPIIWSILKVQRPEKIDIKAIKQIIKEERVLKTVIEPKTSFQAKILEKKGFRKSKDPFLPTKTLIIDLTKTEKKLQNNLKKDCRYALRKTKSLMTKIVKPEEFRIYWKSAVSLKRHVPNIKTLRSLYDSFPSPHPLFLTSHNGEAGAIFIKAKNIAYYWQAFTGKAGRTSLAQYRLVWQGMLWAKKRGVKLFDFEGIYDKRYPNKSWLGFTHFKKSFGGETKKYPGVYKK